MQLSSVARPEIGTVQFIYGITSSLAMSSGKWLLSRESKPSVILVYTEYVISIWIVFLYLDGYSHRAEEQSLPGVHLIKVARSL